MANDILEAAGKYIGVTEVSGAMNNPKIVSMFRKATGTPEDDSVPWCAAFVGAVLKDAGIKGTMKLNARSYLDWGEEVTKPEAGDVVIFWRGKKDGWQGHVAFFVRFDGDKIVVLGGNQGDAVSIKSYAGSRWLGYRRAKQGVKVVNPPVRAAVGVTLASGAVIGLAGFFDQIKSFFAGLF